MAAAVAAAAAPKNKAITPKKRKVQILTPTLNDAAAFFHNFGVIFSSSFLSFFLPSTLSFSGRRQITPTPPRRQAAAPNEEKKTNEEHFYPGVRTYIHTRFFIVRKK